MLGKALYRLKAGGRATFELRLSASALAALTHSGQHRLSAGLTVSASGGRTLSENVVLVATRHR